MKDELWRCRPCCCCSPTAVKECWLQQQTSRVSSLVLKLSQLGTHPSLLCHCLAGFTNCSAGTYRCSTPPHTELEHSRSVPAWALEAVFPSSCFVLNPSKMAIPQASHSEGTSRSPLNAVEWVKSLITPGKGSLQHRRTNFAPKRLSTGPQESSHCEALLHSTNVLEAITSSCSLFTGFT